MLQAFKYYISQAFSSVFRNKLMVIISVSTLTSGTFQISLNHSLKFMLLLICHIQKKPRAALSLR